MIKCHGFTFSTGGGRIEDAAIVVGNILFDFDYEAMTAVWQTPWPSFRLLAQKALRQRIITMKDLAMNVSMEQVTDLLIESFATSMGRELELGELTSEEWQVAEEEAKELASPDYLALHKTNSTPEPMRTLKISARAFIRYDEVQMDGYDVRGSFWLSEEVIQEVILQSTPERNWGLIEQRLCGTPFKVWRENLTAIMGS